jgi:hypothetical protein
LDSVGSFTQRFSQEGNILSEIAFLDECAGPDAFHQVVFLDDVPAVLDKRQENVENLRGKRYWLTLAQ